MFLWELTKSNPVAGFALIASLATLFWCLKLLRRVCTKMERYMMGILGLIAMYHGLHILQAEGFWTPPQYPGVTGAVDMSISGMCLACALILQVFSAERHSARIQLRVAQVNLAPVGAGYSGLPDRAALAVFGLDARGIINLWHSTSEEFFGWRRDEVLGTRLPFREESPVHFAAGVPGTLHLRTRKSNDLDVLAWFMPVPGSNDTMVLVIDVPKPQRREAVGGAVVRAELNAV